MDVIKVLNLVSWFPNEKNPVEGIFIKEHIKAIGKFADVRIGYGVEGGQSGRIRYRKELVDGLELLSFEFGKVPLPGGSFFPYLKGFYEVFRKLRKEGFYPHIIHAHVYRAGVPAVILGSLTGIPVIVTEHYSIFTGEELWGRERVKAEFVFRNAKLITSVSEFLGRHIKRYAGNTPVRVIPNVVDHTLFYPPPSHASGEPLRFVTVAHLESHKGIDYLIDAAGILKKEGYDFRVTIVGDGSRREEYEKRIRRLGLERFLMLVGEKSHSEVARLMRESDVFVLPSLGETFGVVLIEAMATGLPLIATDCGGPSEIVDRDSGLIVPPADEYALAQAMKKFLRREVSFDREKIYRKSLRFSYERVGREFFDLYKELLKGGKSER